jgi:hypothetical protein
MSEQHPPSGPGNNLNVRVFGMGANDRPFFQQAQASNLSPDGALLSGIENELKVGDTIGVQCGDKKARCKVVSVASTGPLQRIQAKVQILSEQECPWKVHLPVTGNATAAPALPADNRRKFYRHKISVPMELRDERVNTPLRVNATDISGNGCYIETILPLAKGTTLKVDFWMESEKVATTAVVRTSDGGVGMGIEFIGLTDESRQRIQQHLDKVDPRTQGFADAAKSS